MFISGVTIFGNGGFCISKGDFIFKRLSKFGLSFAGRNKWLLEGGLKKPLIGFLWTTGGVFCCTIGVFIGLGGDGAGILLITAKLWKWSYLDYLGYLGYFAYFGYFGYFGYLGLLIFILIYYNCLILFYYFNWWFYVWSLIKFGGGFSYIFLIWSLNLGFNIF